jgi:hypothetical protein
MATGYYLPPDDSGRADLLDHLADTLPKYTERFKLTPEILGSRRDDAVAFRYALHGSDGAQAYAQHRTAHKNLLRDGGDGTGDWPLPLILTQTEPPAVAPGIIPRLTSFVTWLKSQSDYNDAIGQDLWLVGTKQVIDSTTWKPNPTIQLQGGHPVIGWTKGKATSLEILVDRGDGNGFVLLTISSSPPTTDNTPLPPASTSAVWKYKAIYHLRDDQVGHWSDVVSIAVGG